MNINLYFTKWVCAKVDMETYTQYSREELDQLYSPSRYSKKLPADVVVAKHVQAVEQCEMATITHHGHA